MSRNRAIENKRVKFTGDWSSDSKLSSILTGYWEDPFFKFFNKTNTSKLRRTSLINRGYFVRFKVCDFFFRQILENFDTPVQIVCLGCGMDTTYFRILPEFEKNIIRFYDVDFRSVISEKRSIIRHSDILKLMAGNKLHLISCDLRDILMLHKELSCAGFDFNKPTLVYSECVVNYLLPNESQNILNWIVDSIPNSVWLAYEQCNAKDAFGKIMINHFCRSGCPIYSLVSANSVKEQKKQLLLAGFKFAEVINAWDAFIQISKQKNHYFPLIDDKNHQFDEYETLLATCLHYSARIGANGEIGAVKDFVKRFVDHLPDSHQTPCDLKLPVTVQKTSNLPKLSGQNSTSVFSNSILTVGGVGENFVRMKHLIGSTVRFPSLSKPEEDILIGSSILGENSLFYERLYSSLVTVNVYKSEKLVNPQLYLFGGRKAPSQPCANDLIALQIHDRTDYETNSVPDDNTKTEARFTITAKIIELDEDDDKPCPRWRHGMSYLTDEHSVILVLFGGRDTSNVLDDFWTFDLTNSKWTNETELNSSLPSGRHSHCMTANSTGSIIYLTGGISKNDVTLCPDSFWMFQKEIGWTAVHQLNSICRRIGHSSVIHENKLILLGGYGADSSYSLFFTVTCIDLQQFTFQTFIPDIPCDEILLPFGFSTCHIWNDKTNGNHQLIVFGGGGNCFSFGTHYNQSFTLIELKSLQVDL